MKAPPKKRYVTIAGHRLALDAVNYERLEALARVKDEQKEPRTVAEMASICMGEQVMVEFERTLGRNPGTRPMLPEGIALMRELLDNGMFRRRLHHAHGAIAKARRWIREVDKLLKSARKGRRR